MKPFSEIIAMNRKSSGIVGACFNHRLTRDYCCDLIPAFVLLTVQVRSAL